MSEELISIDLLIVSEATAERDMVRQVATYASIPVQVAEIAAAADASAGCDLVARQPFDLVLFDSRMPRGERQKLLNAVRAVGTRPLAILIGAAELKTREVLTDGLAIDGVLAKPLLEQEVSDLLANCIRARLPNRVLIVDDSATVRSVIRRVLQASRYRLEPEEAADGAAAIARAKQQRFDIIFLDCNMPGLDGFATMNALKQVHADSKLVMITGTRDMRIEDRARAEGATDFLYKPFFANDIDAVLNRLFGLMRPRWN